MQNSKSTLVKSVKSDLDRQSRRKSVLVVRRVIDGKGFHTKTEVDIRSQHVALAMREMHKGVEDVSLRAKPPMVPLEIFYHSKQGLRTKLQHATASDLLWVLFAANVLLYRHHAFVDHDQVLKLRSIKQGRNLQTLTSHWSLNCHIVADDGVKFGLAYERSIQANDEFDGAQRITDLHTFPIQYHPDAVRITAAALVQGRRFAQFKTSQVMETSGPAMFQKRDAAFVYQTIKVSTHGRAIIDPTGFRSYNPGLPSTPSVVHRVRSPDVLTKEEYIICTPVVLGFCLGTKRWGGFAISRLLDLKWNPQAFQDLVLEERAKKLVHSLIKQHSPDDGFDDLVAGKGKGIISLFSSPPGSGKTLTAEAVAESTRRPLYICSAGDLGSTASGIDEHRRR